MRRALRLATALLLLPAAAAAHESKTAKPAPAYRPDAEKQEAFLKDVGEARVAVLPVIVRSSAGTAHEAGAAERIAALLNERGLAEARVVEGEVDLNAVTAPVQWAVFEQGLELVGAHVASSTPACDYAMVVECLITRRRGGGQAVGGLQCYIVDARGANAFSFLMNSHHMLFRDAQLRAEDTAAGRESLVNRCALLAAEALRRQIAEERAERDGGRGPEGGR